MAIWVVTWDTESGDAGVEGYWTEKPSETQLAVYMAGQFPDDFESQTLYYVVEKLEQVKIDG